MNTILLIVWFIIGACSARLTYYAFLNDWYDTFKEDYREYDDNTLYTFIFLTPIMIVGGVVSLIITYLCSKAYGIRLRWSFKIPKKETKVWDFKQIKKE